MSYQSLLYLLYRTDIQGSFKGRSVSYWGPNGSVGAMGTLCCVHLINSSTTLQHAAVQNREIVVFVRTPSFCWTIASQAR